MIDSPSPELLEAAWEQPVAAIYRRTGLLRQKLSALCGPTSAAMVLRSIGLDANPSTVLEGTSVRSVFGVRPWGMTLDQVTEVMRARCGRPVTALRDLDLEQFRVELSRVNDPGRRYIANFDRDPLFGWGGGHHSPVAAYLPAADVALVVDVNPRVAPWLVSTERLHRAVATHDRSSRQSRGLVRVE
jgi:hypothetical protein